MLPHLADQLRYGIPVLVAAGIVELLHIMGGLGCVGLEHSSGTVSRPGLESESETGERVFTILLPGLQANSHYGDSNRQFIRTDRKG